MLASTETLLIYLQGQGRNRNSDKPWQSIKTPYYTFFFPHVKTTQSLHSEKRATRNLEERMRDWNVWNFQEAMMILRVKSQTDMWRLVKVRGNNIFPPWYKFIGWQIPTVCKLMAQVATTMRKKFSFTSTRYNYFLWREQFPTNREKTGL